MATPRRALLLSTLVLAGCKPSPKDGPVAPTDSSPASQPGGGPGGPLSAATNQPVELIHIEGHVHGLEDMLDGFDGVLTSWSENGGNWKAQAQAILLSTGYGPGMLDALDLKGQFGFEVAYPHPGQAHATPQHAEVAVSVPTKDNRALLDAMPSAYRPQPMGEGMWELLQGELRYLLRSTPNSMQIGFTPEQLDHAGDLVAAAPNGRRVQVRAWNIPKDDIDPNAVLGGGRGAFMDRLGEVVQELESMEAEIDMGRDRDLQLLARVVAPFDRLPLEVYGPATATPSEVASILPPDAAFHMSMRWGDPAPLHRGIDRTIDAGAVPPPFDAVVKDVVDGAHAVLGALSNEVVMAIYVDGKGQGTILIGAGVSDAAKARKGLQSIEGAAEKAIKSHIALVGDDKENKYSVTYKPEGLGYGGGKADQFIVTVPPYMHDDTKAISMLLGKKKPQLEMVSYVDERFGFIALGAGSRKVMGTVVRSLKKAPSDNLESDGGLALARASSDGCSLCVAADVKQSARLAAILLRDSGDVANGDELVTRAEKLSIEGALALGIAIKDRTGSLGVGIPRTLLFAPREDAVALLDMFDAIADPQPPEPAKPAKSPSKSKPKK